MRDLKTRPLLPLPRPTGVTSEKPPASAPATRWPVIAGMRFQDSESAESRNSRIFNSIRGTGSLSRGSYLITNRERCVYLRDIQQGDGELSRRVELPETLTICSAASIRLIVALSLVGSLCLPGRSSMINGANRIGQLSNARYMYQSPQKRMDGPLCLRLVS